MAYPGRRWRRAGAGLNPSVSSGGQVAADRSGSRGVGGGLVELATCVVSLGLNLSEIVRKAISVSNLHRMKGMLEKYRNIVISMQDQAA